MLQFERLIGGSHDSGGRRGRIAVLQALTPGAGEPRCAVLCERLSDRVVPARRPVVEVDALALPHAREGRLRALAVTATERLAVAPDVPTIGEAGLPGAEMMGWAGVYAPARTPAPVVARLAEAVSAAMRDPAVVEMFDRTGTIRWADKSGEDMRRVLAEEVPRARELIARSGGGAGVRTN